VQDESGRSDPTRHGKIVGEARNGLLVQLEISRGQVDQIRRVTERVGDGEVFRGRLSVGG
jgi:hypothetical protein